MNVINLFFNLIAQEKIISDAEAATEKLGLTRNQLLSVDNELTDNGKKYIPQVEKETKATDSQTDALIRNRNARQAILDITKFLAEQEIEYEQAILGTQQQTLNTINQYVPKMYTYCFLNFDKFSVIFQTVNL